MNTSTGVKTALLLFALGSGMAAQSSTDQPKVFVRDNLRWATVITSGGIANWRSSTALKGDQGIKVADFAKSLSQQCPTVVITNNPLDADYGINFEPVDPKTKQERRLGIFNAVGASVLQTSSRNLETMLPGVCSIIGNDFQAHGRLNAPTSSENVSASGATPHKARGINDGSGELSNLGPVREVVGTQTGSTAPTTELSVAEASRKYKAKKKTSGTESTQPSQTSR